MKLVIAEKPSVAQSLAKVIGANKRCDGYLEGGGYLVSWCVGHLVELSAPERYDERFAKWRLEDLPILPERFLYEVSAGTRKQYQILKSLMERSDVESLVCATDAGREGELIFRLIYTQARCKKPFERLWISSMEDAVIQEGFEKLKPGTSYTLTVRKYIIAPLGEMYLSEVTADDIKLAMVPVSKRSEDVYNKVNMLFKSIFYSAEYSNLIKDNPAKNLNAKGGIPKKEKEALTDAQAEQLLETIKDLPPYVFVMIGLYSGLRREEILALQWDCVHLEGNTPYISVRRAWRSEKNRPVVSTDLKTPAAKRDVPIPENLADCLRKEKEKSISEYVIADRNGQPLSYSQFVRIWNYIKVRSTKERTLYKYVNGQAIKKKFKPEAGQKCVNRENIVYSLDFTVTPHQLRHTYITNLIYAGIDPKTVQYLAGHENSKVTMDIYAKAKYNKPEELSSVVNNALKKPVKSESGAKTGQ